MIKILTRAIAVAVVLATLTGIVLSGPWAPGPSPVASFSRVAGWSSEGRFMNWKGLAIFYRATPSQPRDPRPTLLLLHGFPSSSFDWLEVWAPLEERFGLIAPDFLGFGLSSKPYEHDYSLMEQADIVEELLRKLGISEYHILAHDYGDTVAQELLARHNATARKGAGVNGLRSLVLLNGGVLPDENRPLLMQRLLANRVTGPLMRQFVSRTVFGRSFSRVFGPESQPTSQELDEQWALITHNGGTRVVDQVLGYLDERQAHEERWVGALIHSVVPVRLVNGPADPVSGERVARAYRSRIPAADVVLLDGRVGHYPQIEDPEGVLNAVFEFHARISQR